MNASECSEELIMIRDNDALQLVSCMFTFLNIWLVLVDQATAPGELPPWTEKASEAWVPLAYWGAAQKEGRSVSRCFVSSAKASWKQELGFIGVPLMHRTSSNPCLNWVASRYYRISNMILLFLWLEKNLQTSVLSEAISCFTDRLLSTFKLSSLPAEFLYFLLWLLVSGEGAFLWMAWSHSSGFNHVLLCRVFLKAAAVSHPAWAGSARVM